MKAAVIENRTKGVFVRDVEIPKIKPNEMLVKVKKAGICGTDIHLYHWNQWCENVKAKNPMIIGHEYCGEVVEIGSEVKGFKVGDMVAAEPHVPCGICYQCRTGYQHICKDMKIIGVHSDGAFAEYTVLPEVCAWKFDKSIDPEVGALYEPFGILVQGVLADQVAGIPVLITGAGPLGCLAVGVAKACGASKVFATDIKPARLEMAKMMGADVVINSATDNFEEIIMNETNGMGPGAFIELSGSEAALQSGFKVLRKTGWATLIGLYSKNPSLDFVNDVIYKQAKIYGMTGRHMYKTWYAADELIKAGKVPVKNVITHHYPLDRIEEAIQMAESGNAGKIMIDIE